MWLLTYKLSLIHLDSCATADLMRMPDADEIKYDACAGKSMVARASALSWGGEGRDGSRSGRPVS